MRKQYLLLIGGLALICLLFFFGKTTVPFPPRPKMENSVPAYNINSSILSVKESLSNSQQLHVTELENSISRGDVKEQQIKSYNSLAEFYRDSVKNIELYIYYTGEAAKLDNSEKNLTFAARLYLTALRGEHDEAKLEWEGNSAISLFEKALALNPENTDLKIGLGSSYIFGKGKSGDPQETMAGVQQLLSVVRKDSNNMKAQLVLGIGGFVSGQYDKAIPRFLKVVNAEPNNVEAIAFLADTYAATGQKADAVKWYTRSKELVNDPSYSKEVDDRIKLLK